MRQERLAQMAAAAEEECGGNEEHEHRFDGETGRPKKRTFFRSSRLDVATLLKAPDPGLGRMGMGGGRGILDPDADLGAGPGNGIAREWGEY